MDILNKHLNVEGEDKSLHSFILLFAIMTALLLLTLLSFFSIRYITVNQITEFLKITIIVIIALVISILNVVCSFVIYVYKMKTASYRIIWISRMGLTFFLPVIIALSEFINFRKTEIRQFYIRLNNIIIKSSVAKHKINKILVLLPHCLQNSDCTYKITTDINNCRKCFKCPVGYINESTKDDEKVYVNIASGGSSARSIVYKAKPDLIIAVACERDLVSGIADIKDIPTIGILNKRPNGPCFNTDLNLQELENVLNSVLN